MNHGLFAVEHAFIHVDVDHLSAVFNLLPGNGQSFVKLFSRISLAKRAEPVTLVRSPTFTNKLSWFRVRGSKP